MGSSCSGIDFYNKKKLKFVLELPNFIPFEIVKGLNSCVSHGSV